jgi:hypothetical protein
MLWRDMRGRTKGGNHKELQDLDPIGFPHKEEKSDWWKCRSRSPLSFPQKDSISMAGMEEGGQAFKVNNGGERNPKCGWLKEEEGVFIGGWKSGRWKKLEWDFGHKFGRTELQARWFGARSGGTELQDEILGDRRTIWPHAELLFWYVVWCTAGWFGV